MYADQLIGSKIVLRKDETVQEMLYAKFPALPLKLPILIQMVEFQTGSYPKMQNN